MRCRPLTGHARAAAYRLAGLLVVLVAAFASAGHPAVAGVPHFDLVVELDPTARMLSAAGSITVAAGEPVTLALDSRFEVQQFDFDGAAVAGVREPARGRTRWTVQAPAERPGEIRLRYAGVLDALDTTLDHREVLGPPRAVSGPEGAYLAAGSGWYPEPERVRLTYRLSVTVPSAFRAVAPGRIAQEMSGNARNVALIESRTPLPGIDLIAGPYAVASRAVVLPSGREIVVRTYFHPEIEALAAGYLDSAARHLARYDREIGPYAFDAYSIVSSPLPTGFGMPGLAYIGRQVLRLPFIRAISLRHEVLHDWWGNGVVPDYAHGNWAEGLTTLLADYAHREEQGEAQAKAMRAGWLRDYAAVPPERDRALSSFRSRRHGADQAVGYNKTAFVFFMLRDLIGADAFRAALRRIWREHRLGVASWQALRHAFEAEAGTDLEGFFAQWVERPGAPRLDIAEARRSADPSGYRLALVVRQESPPYRLRVPLRIGHEAGTSSVSVDLAGASAHAEIALAARPLWVEIDPDMRLFRRLAPDETAPTLRQVLLDPRTRVALADDDEAARAAALRVARAALETDVRLAEPGLAGDVPLLIVGLHQAVERLLVRWKLPAQSVPGAAAGAAFAYASRTPAGRLFAVVSAPDVDALAALARPLPHLGAQSYAVFAGARSTTRGLWPASVRRYPVTD